MKVRALAGLSGPFGSKLAGDEFTVSADLGADLVQRKLAETVATPTKPQAEPPTPKE